jgi:hypothetical protein
VVDSSFHSGSLPPGALNFPIQNTVAQMNLDGQSLKPLENTAGSIDAATLQDWTGTGPPGQSSASAIVRVAVSGFLFADLDFAGGSANGSSSFQVILNTPYGSSSAFVQLDAFGRVFMAGGFDTPGVINVGGVFSATVDDTLTIPLTVPLNQPFSVRVDFLARVSVTSFSPVDTTFVSGFLGANGGNTLTYQILGVEPGVSFRQVPEPSAGLIAALALGGLMALRRGRRS